MPKLIGASQKIVAREEHVRIIKTVINKKINRSKHSVTIKKKTIVISFIETYNSLNSNIVKDP